MVFEMEETLKLVIVYETFNVHRRYLRKTKSRFLIINANRIRTYAKSVVHNRTFKQVDHWVLLANYTGIKI